METRQESSRFISKRTSIVILVLWTLLCALVPLVVALEGPTPTPPGGVTLTKTGSGDCSWTYSVDECIGRPGGIDLKFADFDPTQYQVLHWGPVDANAVGLALDCFIDQPGETMGLYLPGSSLANGVAQWIGSTQITYWNGFAWTTEPVDTRFTLSTSDLGGPVSLRPGSDLGIVGTAFITVTGDFVANMLMEARLIGSPVWEPALVLFDRLRTRPEHEECAISEVTHGFYFEDVPISALQATNDSPTALGALTTLTATITAGTNVTYSWDLGDGDFAVGAVAAHVYPAVGTYTATVTATNSVGFLTATTLVTVDEAIDGLEAINDSPTDLGSITTLTATITAGTNVTYSWDLGDGDFAVGAVAAHVYPAVGTYTATVTATNSVGFAMATTKVSVGDVAIGGLAATNDSPTDLGGTTTLTATITAGTDVTYAWDLGDETSAVGAVVTHVYPAIGTYTATVTATNSLGDSTATTLVTVDEAISGLSAVNDSETKLGAITTLTASITAGSNVSYAWDLGDGDSGVGPVVAHVYPAIGVYTATVTATNSLGFASATTHVNIVSADFYVYLPEISKALAEP
jgi:PKD repeat protein